MRKIAAVCGGILLMLAAPLSASAQTSAAQQAALQAQLDQVNAEISQNQAKLSDEEKTDTTLQDEVEILDSQIQEQQLEIEQRNLTIQQLDDNIGQKETGISSLDTQTAAGEASLAQILRETNEIDQESLAVRALGGTLTDFFNEIDDFETIQQALGEAFTTMSAQRGELSASETALQSQEQEQSSLLQAQQAQQASLQQTETQKQNLITETKGQEALYQQVIADQQQTAAQIEQAIFALRGVSTSVSFGDMYNYAKEASAVTNVDPAFILGILSEESNLGQDDGDCTYEEAMDPTRDIPVFLQLTQELGINPDSVKVSCAPSYGWGGAMGPAQFIPSTWVLYEARIAQAAGQNPPNPWDPRTATFASALLLEDNGADAQTAASEQLAALRYFAGWTNASNPAYAFYGTDVMCLTNKVQQEIDVLNGTPDNAPPIECD